MLLKCTLQSFIFGWIYALYFLKVTEEEKMYFTGQWNYTSWSGMILHVLTIVASCITVAAVFVVLIPSIITNILLGYIVNTLGMTATGFLSIYLSSKA